jgi:hypothetical protein
MRFLARRAGLLAGLVLATCCILSMPAWTGGAGFGEDDDNADDTGPSYFGFVRDSNGLAHLTSANGIARPCSSPANETSWPIPIRRGEACLALSRQARAYGGDACVAPTESTVSK